MIQKLAQLSYVSKAPTNVGQRFAANFFKYLCSRIENTTMMDEAQLLKSFEGIGLSETKAKETLKNPQLTNVLKDVIKIASTKSKMASTRVKWSWSTHEASPHCSVPIIS